MAITKVSNSSLKNLNKYDSFLAGNAAYDPGATFLIQRVTATGSSSTITINSIPLTYSHLQLRCFYSNASGDYDGINFNGDTTAGNYTMHRLRGNGSSATAQGFTSFGTNVIDQYSVNGTTYSNIKSSVIVDIHDYTSTSKYKTIRTFNGFNVNGSGYVGLNSGLWLSTSAITSITFSNGGASNFTSGSTFALYGLKG
jgi:hypothetical protein